MRRAEDFRALTADISDLLSGISAHSAGWPRLVIAEGLVAAPHCTEIGFGESVPPRRRIRQVEVVSFDEGMADLAPSEEVVQFIGYRTFARA